MEKARQELEVSERAREALQLKFMVEIEAQARMRQEDVDRLTEINRNAIEENE